MKLEKVKNLTGGECLAKPIVLGMNQMLVYEGTYLKKEYICTLWMRTYFGTLKINLIN